MTLCEQSYKYRGAVQGPRHGNIDAAADDYECLAEADDPNKSGKHGHAPQMSAGEESWRDEAGKQQKDESGQVGDENSAMLAKEVHVRRLPLVDFSASELVSTATSRMAPEAIGCQ